ncbi:MAG: PIN domain-containing protein [Ginsengibacter sp.]
MKDDLTFIDSNVIIYLFSGDIQKKQIALSLLSAEYIISTQVINENVNVCLKKLRLSKVEAFAHGNKLLTTYQIASILPSTISKAFQICLNYSIIFWDSLIISAAL